MLCAGLSLCYVRDLVCVMCGIKSVLCAVFGLCYVQSLVCVMCSLASVLCVAFSVSGSPLKRLALRSYICGSVC